MAEQSQYKESSAESLAHMRNALPLISRHGLAATPPNYAVWYDYVSGRNEQLRTAIDRHLSAHEPVTNELCQSLFERYVSTCSADQLVTIQRDVGRLLLELRNMLASAGGDTGKFADALRANSERLSGNPALETLMQVLGSLRSETDSIMASGEHLQNQLSVQLQEVEELRNELESARREASVDYLTGLPNRKAFYAALHAAIEAFTPPPDADPAEAQTLCLLVLDIDHFKGFNDTYGHLLGDKVLRHVASRIKEVVRGTDLVARFGGEEFVVLLPNTPYPGALTVAENIRATIARARLIRTDTKDPLEPVYISVGVATYQGGEEADSFIDRADQALYHAKEHGRNRVIGETAL